MKNRTYRNMVRTANLIEKKGYGKAEAGDMAFKIWEAYDYEMSLYNQKLTSYIPDSIERRINRIINKAEYEAQYA